MTKATPQLCGNHEDITMVGKLIEFGVSDAPNATQLQITRMITTLGFFTVGSLSLDGFYIYKYVSEIYYSRRIQNHPVKEKKW